MSLSMRPVIENWGTGIDFFSSFDPETALAAISVAIQSNFATNDYGDMRVVNFLNGKAFVDFIEKLDDEHTKKIAAEMEEAIDDDDDSDEEDDSDSPSRTKQLSDFLQNLHAMADSWRKMIDPQDGSLRLYIDTN